MIFIKQVTLGLINKLKCQFITIDYRIIDSYYFILVCQTKLDLCFIVDTSGSVGLYNFQRVQSFLKKLIDFFNVGRDETHIALITYSYSVCPETAVQGYSAVPSRHTTSFPRLYDVYTTSATWHRRRIDVETTSCVYWVFAEASYLTFTCSNTTIEILEKGVKRLSGVFIINFEHISRLFLVLLLSALNK